MGLRDPLAPIGRAKKVSYNIDQFSSAGQKFPRVGSNVELIDCTADMSVARSSTRPSILVAPFRQSFHATACNIGWLVSLWHTCINLRQVSTRALKLKFERMKPTEDDMPPFRKPCAFSLEVFGD